MSKIFQPEYVGHWRNDDITELINSNKVRGDKYNLRVALNHKYKKFYFKYYLGENVILEQECKNQMAHLAITEMNIRFKLYLDDKDREYSQHVEDEKEGWAQRNIKKDDIT